MDSLVLGLDIGHLWTVAGWDVYATWVATGIAGAIIMTTLNAISVKFVAIVQTTVVLLILIVGFFFVGGAGVTGSISNLDPLFAVKERPVSRLWSWCRLCLWALTSFHRPRKN